MTFLSEPAASDAVRSKYDADLASYGFVMNLTHVWAHLPEAHSRLFELQELLMGSFSMRERGILVTATAAANGDSYCSYAWSWKLSKEADAELATAVLAGTDDGLTPREAALARWARCIVRGPSATTQADVDAVRAAGWSDEEVFRVTAFVGLRTMFSTVNAALGARPDAELRALAPPQAGTLVTWGRPIEES
jgi:uncharacterized peroxidase-related enzyme